MPFEDVVGEGHGVEEGGGLPPEFGGFAEEALRGHGSMIALQVWGRGVGRGVRFREMSRDRD